MSAIHATVLRLKGKDLVVTRGKMNQKWTAVNDGDSYQLVENNNRKKRGKGHNEET